MKNLKITVTIILTLLLFSCKKDQPLTGELVGEWELRESVNGLTGIKTSHSAGNGTMLKFTSTNYEILEAGSSINKGSYTIRKYVSYITKKEENQIVYDGKTDVIQSYFIVNAHSLTISIDAHDGSVAIYTRVK